MKSAFLFAISLLLALPLAAHGQGKPAQKTGGALDGKASDRLAPAQIAQVAPPLEKPAGAPAAVAPATPPPTVPPASRDPAEIARIFFGLLEKNEIDTAYLSLTRGSKIAERPEELRALKTKTREAIEVFGAIQGYDLVERKLVGERVLRATYLSLGKEFPLRWRFYFYKAEQTWKLIDMRVDDKLSGIFEELEEPKVVEKP